MSCFTSISLPDRLLQLSLGGISLQWSQGRRGWWRCIYHSLKPQMKMKCELHNKNLYFFTVLDQKGWKQFLHHGSLCHQLSTENWAYNEGEMGRAKERGRVKEMKAHLLQYPQAWGGNTISFPGGDKERIPVKFASDSQHCTECTELQVRTTWTTGQILLLNQFNWLHYTTANK